MSKAFTREDDLPDPSVTRKLPSPLPPGASNYLTPDGAQRLQAELDRLLEVERPRAAAASADAHSREHLAAVEQRIRHLQHSLQTAVVVTAPTGEPQQV